MNDDHDVPEVQIPDDAQPELRPCTPEEQARDEAALLTLLHARLEHGSDFELIYPRSEARGLRA